MVSESSSPSNQAPSQGDDKTSNPFIEFRRYADAQLSSLLQSVVGLPSALTAQSSSSKRMPGADIPTAHEKEEHRATSWDRDPYAQVVQRRRELVARGEPLPGPLHPFSTANGDEDSSSRGDVQPSQDLPRLFSTLLHYPFAHFLSPDLDDCDLGLFYGGRWPRDYLTISPYSPLQLEKQPDLALQQSWREAFEDLLWEMDGDEPTEWKERTEWEKPADWMSRMCSEWGGSRRSEARHNTLSLLWDLIDASEECQSEESGKAETQPESELDLYESVSHKRPQQESGSPRDALDDSPTGAGSQNSNMPSLQGNSIISTLTTTERTTAPDGSVQTKMVLKKRFADGRQECSETLHTSAAPASASAGKDAVPTIDEKRDASVVDAQQKKQERKQQQKKNGWFWSD
ncbi:MAG: hypothetical protein M1837_001480 [Sclerophora amabilis]|nr:MAG: hypothetical protein M1837_001480 [Sclerophora amabilis]